VALGEVLARAQVLVGDKLRLEGSSWTAVGDLNEVHSELRLRCNRCVFDLLGRLGHGLSVEFRYDEFASENSYPYFDLLTDWTTGQRAEFTSFERARPSNLHLDPLLRTAIRCFAMTWLLRKSATRL
jgi:hypothetical protein